MSDEHDCKDWAREWNDSRRLWVCKGCQSQINVFILVDGCLFGGKREAVIDDQADGDTRVGFEGAICGTTLDVTEAEAWAASGRNRDFVSCPLGHVVYVCQECGPGRALLEHEIPTETCDSCRGFDK